MSYCRYQVNQWKPVQLKLPSCVLVLVNTNPAVPRGRLLVVRSVSLAACMRVGDISAAWDPCRRLTGSVVITCL